MRLLANKGEGHTCTQMLTVEFENAYNVPEHMAMHLMVKGSAHDPFGQIPMHVLVAF